MELLVCVKQVPDDSVAVSLDANGAPKTADIAPVVNAFDTYALEMATRCKEAHGGSVTVLTVAGEDVVASLRNCLAVGADKAFMLNETAECDGQGVAHLLAKASAKAGEAPFDVIFVGSEATDSASAQVGVMLAEELGLPVVTNVLAVEPAEGGVQLKQETDEGYRVVTAPTPCVVTIVKPEYEPRYPSIKSKMAARKMPVGALTTADVEADAAKFGPEGAKTERVAISAPAKREAGVKIQEKEAAVAVSRALEMMAGQKLI